MRLGADAIGDVEPEEDADGSCGGATLLDGAPLVTGDCVEASSGVVVSGDGAIGVGVVLAAELGDTLSD